MTFVPRQVDFMPPQKQAAPGETSNSGGGLEAAETQPNVRLLDAAPEKDNWGQLETRMDANESPPPTLPRPADV